ncbi:MAG: CvpA family protein, partial [Actinomycetota bacterium]|nr:CvpA family protein [Actinomycetota bacterium]
MNLFDGFILLVAVVAAVGGYRLGFLARALSWVGLGVGLYLTTRFLADLLQLVPLPAEDPTGRLVVAVGILLLGAF